MSREPKGKRTKKVFNIITEGETEQKYILKFRQMFRCSAVNIDKINPCGKQIINRATSYWKGKRIYDQELKGVIIDKDALTEEDFNSILTDATNKGIEVFFSNYTFEVWLLAHFEPITKGILPAVTLKEKLSRYLSQEYKKGDAGQLSKIAVNFDQAVENTRNVCEISYDTQCTNVGKLCQSLREDS
jgi:abortive phage resistance protein, putative